MHLYEKKKKKNLLLHRGQRLQCQVGGEQNNTAL